MVEQPSDTSVPVVSGCCSFICRAPSVWRTNIARHLLNETTGTATGPIRERQFFVGGRHPASTTRILPKLDSRSPLSIDVFVMGGQRGAHSVCPPVQKWQKRTLRGTCCHLGGHRTATDGVRRWMSPATGLFPHVGGLCRRYQRGDRKRESVGAEGPFRGQKGGRMERRCQAVAGPADDLTSCADVLEIWGATLAGRATSQRYWSVAVSDS